MIRSLLTILATSAVLTVASNANALEFREYNGFSGYQDFRLGQGYYYVAYHGGRGDLMASVEQAWKIRVSKLCLSEGANYFIELRYPAEPVLKGDAGLISSAEEFRSGFRKVKGGGVVYIPVFTGPSAPLYLDSPSKMEYVRCVTDAARALKAQRLVSATENSDPKVLEKLNGQQ